jgi:hypothetical protein
MICKCSYWEWAHGQKPYKSLTKKQMYNLMQECINNPKKHKRTERKTFSNLLKKQWAAIDMMYYGKIKPKKKG